MIEKREEPNIVTKIVYEVLYGAANIPMVPISFVDRGRIWAGMVGEDARKYGLRPVAVARGALRFMPESIRETINDAVNEGLGDYKRRNVNG